MQLQNRIGHGARQAKAGERGPDGAQDQLLRLRSADHETADKNVVTDADSHPRRDIREVTGRGWRRSREWRRSGRWQARHAVEELPARDIVSGQDFLIAHDRVHYRDNLLSAGIRVSEPERMTQLVEKNAPDIRDRRPGTGELERTAVGVKGSGLIKEDIGFDHGRARIPVIGHRECAPAEGLAENAAGEND